MIVVDSSVWIDHFRGDTSAASTVLGELLRNGDEIAITDVIYMELLRGVREKHDLDVLRDLLRQTIILRMESLEDYELAAELFREVRSMGLTIRQSTDCMIAAVCIREGLALLHDDVDFARIASASELRTVS